jgi:hypothetical protein
VWGSRCTDPRLLDLGTSWRWVVSFTLRLLYPREKSPWYPLDRRLDGLQSWSGWHGAEKILSKFISMKWPLILWHVYPLLTVAAWSTAWTVFAHLDAGIVGSNPTQGMDVWCVYVFILCLCCPVFRYWPCDGLITRPKSPTVCEKNDYVTWALNGLEEPLKKKTLLGNDSVNTCPWYTLQQQRGCFLCCPCHDCCYAMVW